MNTKPKKLVKRTEFLSTERQREDWEAKADKEDKDLAQWIRETLDAA